MAEMGGALGGVGLFGLARLVCEEGLEAEGEGEGAEGQGGVGEQQEVVQLRGGGGSM